MKKRCFIIALILFVSFFSYNFMIGEIYSFFEKKEYKTFRERIIDYAEKGETKIYLKDVVSFEWEKGCVMNAYSEESKLHYIAKYLDVDIEAINSFNRSKLNENQEVLIFKTSQRQLLFLLKDWKIFFNDHYKNARIMSNNLPCFDRDTGMINIKQY